MLNNSSNSTSKAFKDLSDDESVFYFAFGSNINSATHKWRRFQFIDIFPAVLYDYKLTFDVRGFAFVEGSFGNVQPCRGECVHGLLMEMKKKDFLTNIKYKEGPHYQVIDINAEAYKDKKIYNAITLSEPNTNGIYAYPSRRYLDLIVQGAEEHKFDQEYIQYLKKFPDVKSSLTVIGSFLRIFFLLIYIVPFACFVIFRKFGIVGGGPFHRLFELLTWPFRAIPALPFNYLPKNTIIKKTIEDPNENKFKYKKN